MLFCIIQFILIIHINVQVTALLETLEFQESASSKGHFALYNCLMLGHTKYNSVQRVYCNPFPAKPFHSSHCLDIVMIRQQGINNGMLLCLQIISGMQGFCFCAMTDTASKSSKIPKCTLVSTLDSEAPGDHREAWGSGD